MESPSRDGRKLSETAHCSLYLWISICYAFDTVKTVHPMYMTLRSNEVPVTELDCRVVELRAAPAVMLLQLECIDRVVILPITRR